MKHSPWGLVERLDFVTSLGFGPTGTERTQLGIGTIVSSLLITDLCTMRPEPGSNEFVVTSLHPGVSRDEVVAATRWDIRFSAEMVPGTPPTEKELVTLRLAATHRRSTPGRGVSRAIARRRGSPPDRREAR